MSSGTVLLGHVAHLRTAALVAPDLPLARLGRCGDATAAQRISRIHVPRCRSTSMHPSREAQSSVVLLTSTRLLASPSLATPESSAHASPRFALPQSASFLGELRRSRLSRQRRTTALPLRPVTRAAALRPALSWREERAVSCSGLPYSYQSLSRSPRPSYSSFPERRCGVGFPGFPGFSKFSEFSESYDFSGSYEPSEPSEPSRTSV